MSTDRLFIIRGLLALRFIDSLADELFTIPMIMLFVENLHVQLVDSSDAITLAIIPAAVGNFFLAPVIDSITHPWALLLCAVVSLFLRAGFWYATAIARSVTWAVVVLTVLPTMERVFNQCSTLAIARANAIGAVRSSEEATLNSVFALKYSFTRGGLFLGHIVYYFLRHFSSSVQHANEVIVIVSICVTVVNVLLVMVLWWPLVEVGKTHVSRSAATMEESSETAILENKLVRAVRTWWELAQQRPLWRVMGICLVLMGTWNIFRYIDIGISMILVRSIGERAPFPLLDAINPIVTIVLAPLAQRYLYGVSSYALLIGGSLVCALSLVPMLFASDSLIAYACFLSLFSVGEVLWYPRYEAYVVNLAPKNRQASFLAAANMPLFICRIVVDLLSGRLIDYFCPGGAGPCHAQPIWAFVLGASLIPPLALFFFRPCLNTTKPKELDIFRCCRREQRTASHKKPMNASVLQSVEANT